MKLDLDRIRERLAVMEAKGVTQRQISMRVAGTPDIVRHILKGRQASTDHLRGRRANRHPPAPLESS